MPSPTKPQLLISFCVIILFLDGTIGKCVLKQQVWLSGELDLYVVIFYPPITRKRSMR